MTKKSINTNWKEFKDYKICKNCGAKILKKSKMIKIPELKIKVETEYSQKNIIIEELVIPKGKRLLTLEEFLFCYNNYRDKFVDLNDKTSELVQSSILELKDSFPYLNVYFGRSFGDLCFGAISSNLYVDSKIKGVRFCKDYKSKNEFRTL